MMQPRQMARLFLLRRLGRLSAASYKITNFDVGATLVVALCLSGEGSHACPGRKGYPYDCTYLSDLALQTHGEGK